MNGLSPRVPFVTASLHLACHEVCPCRHMYQYFISYCEIKVTMRAHHMNEGRRGGTPPLIYASVRWWTRMLLPPVAAVITLL